MKNSNDKNTKSSFFSSLFCISNNSVAEQDDLSISSSPKRQGSKNLDAIEDVDLKQRHDLKRNTKVTLDTKLSGSLKASALANKTNEKKQEK